MNVEQTCEFITNNQVIKSLTVNLKMEIENEKTLKQKIEWIDV